MTDPVAQFKKELFAAYEEFYKEFSHHENIFPRNRMILAMTELGGQYAQVCIKHLLWINGGALIAISPIVQALGVTMSVDVTKAAICYSAGLVFVVLAALLAYASCFAATQFLAHDRNADYNKFILRHAESFFTKEGVEGINKEYGEQKKNARTMQIQSHVYEISAIVFGLASLAGFISGTFYLLSSISG